MNREPNQLKHQDRPRILTAHTGVNGKLGRKPEMRTPFVQTALACPWPRAAPQVGGELGGPGSQAAAERNGRTAPLPGAHSSLRAQHTPGEEAAAESTGGTVLGDEQL